MIIRKNQKTIVALILSAVLLIMVATIIFKTSTDTQESLTNSLSPLHNIPHFSHLSHFFGFPSSHSRFQGNSDTQRTKKRKEKPRRELTSGPENEEEDDEDEVMILSMTSAASSRPSAWDYNRRGPHPNNDVYDNLEPSYDNYPRDSYYDGYQGSYDYTASYRGYYDDGYPPPSPPPAYDGRYDYQDSYGYDYQDDYLESIRFKKEQLARLQREYDNHERIYGGRRSDARYGRLEEERETLRRFSEEIAKAEEEFRNRRKADALLRYEEELSLKAQELRQREEEMKKVEEERRLALQMQNQILNEKRKIDEELQLREQLLLQKEEELKKQELMRKNWNS